MTLEPRVSKIVGVLTRLDNRQEVTMPERRRISAATARRFGRLVMPAGPSPARQHDVLVPVAGGKIIVRIYRPHGPGPFPLHVFVHGGGWCAGTIEERDPRCREISAGAQCVVASVAYRLAPENTFPSAPEDVYASLEWLVTHADDLDVDPSRVAIGGESAGANLAAVVSLMTRDRSGPQLCHQWLDVPATDLTMSQPSVTSVADGYLLDRRDMDEYLACYLPDPADALLPLASPLFADSHKGLPPAWIMSAEYDKLRDDGVSYAAKLKSAGVPVRHQVLEGHVHPSFAFTRIIPSAKAYEREAIAALASAFAEA
ncbi:MAG: alpha/beta hydrolase [Aquihabitans sp.]